MKLLRINKYKGYLLGLITFLYVAVLIMNKDYYPLFIDDCLTQHTPFLISNNFGFNLTSYNTYFFLGASDAAVSGFTFGQNILVFLFRPLLRLLDGYAFFFLNYISTIIAVFTFDLWLENRVKDQLSRTISIMIIIFSGWFMGLYKYQFVSVLWTLPLALYSVDKYLNDKNGIPLTISIAFIGITNYYWLIISTPLFFLYTLFTELYFYKESSFKDVIFKAIKFFGFYVLGIGLSCFVFIPGLLGILNMPRSGSVPLTRVLNFKELFRLVSGFVNPINATNDHNYLISADKYYDSWLTYGGGPLIYSLLITLFVLPNAFKKNDKKFYLTGLYIFLFILTFWKGLYPLLNATWDSRWMLMIVIFNAYFVGLTLNDNEKINTSTIYTIGASIIFLIIACFLISYVNHLYTEGNLRFVALILCVQVLVVILYMIFLNNKKVLIYLATLECVISFIIPFGFMNHKGLSSSLISKDKYYEIYGVAYDISAFLNGRDNSFYRVNEMFQDIDCSNNGLAYGYRSFTLYSSLYNTSIENFANGRFKGYGQWHFTPNKGLFELKELLGSKYLVTFKDTVTIPYGYEIIGEINGNKIYENKYPLSLGYAKDNTLNKETYDHLSEFDKNRALVDTVITYDSNNTSFDDNLKLIAKEEFGDTPIDVSEIGAGILYVKENTDYNMLFTRGYELYAGNELVEKYSSLTDYPSEIYIPENITIVYLFNSTIDKIGYNITYDVYFDDMSDYEERISNLSDEELENIIIKNNEISGDIKVDGDKWVVISLAYDDGFTAYDNGKEIDVHNVNDGLIGLKLEKGNHNIVLKYHTKGLTSGIAISSISAITLLVVVVLRMKRSIS